MVFFDVLHWEEKWNLWSEKRREFNQMIDGIAEQQQAIKILGVLSNKFDFNGAVYDLCKKGVIFKIKRFFIIKYNKLYQYIARKLAVR